MADKALSNIAGLAPFLPEADVTKYTRAMDSVPAQHERLAYIANASKEIDEAIRRDGPCSQKIIRIVLEQVRLRCGQVAVNNLIAQYDLKWRYGFSTK